MCNFVLLDVIQFVVYLKTKRSKCAKLYLYLLCMGMIFRLIHQQKMFYTRVKVTKPVTT